MTGEQTRHFQKVGAKSARKRDRFEAARGKAFVRYRREDGIKGKVLSDFFIGAHAAVGAHTLLTRDPRRYRSYFPTVTVISPAIG